MSRQAFLRELLISTSTPRTPLFDDYTRGSYHVNKLDVTRALPTEADRCGATVRGVLVLGPLGGLWTYDVITFLEDGDAVRVNALVMPHARVTEKRTGRMAPEDVESALSAITAAPAVRAGLPLAPGPPAGEPSDRAYHMLLARYTNGKTVYWYADFGNLWQNDPAALASAQPVLDALRRLRAPTRETYPNANDASSDE